MLCDILNGVKQRDTVMSRKELQLKLNGLLRVSGYEAVRDAESSFETPRFWVEKSGVRLFPKPLAASTVWKKLRAMDEDMLYATVQRRLNLERMDISA
jgi:hypothetical protein